LGRWPEKECPENANEWRRSKTEEQKMTKARSSRNHHCRDGAQNVAEREGSGDNPNGPLVEMKIGKIEIEEKEIETDPKIEKECGCEKPPEAESKPSNDSMSEGPSNEAEPLYDSL
jgi:hypothetical protein